MKKPIFMENTEISAERSAGEISACLVRAGATSISTKFDAGKLVGLNWTMRVGPADLQFAMPARVEPVYQILLKRRAGFTDNATKLRIRAQAERVAWRQLLRWVQAQLAMIDVGMAQSAEVFMPYIQQHDGRTFFEYFESKQLQLDASKNA